jgi:hypothetical protein
MTQPLRSYSVIADGERGAVCGPSGEIVWLCIPQWHDEAVFAELIGGPGGYAITPVGRFVASGNYLDGSLIWRHRWITEHGIVECDNALAMPADPHRAVLLRRVRAVDGPAKVRVRLDLRPGFGTKPAWRRRTDGWFGRAGPMRLRWQAGPGLSPDGGAVLDLPAGAQRDLVLELADTELPDPVDPAQLWAATERAWSEAVPDCAATASPRDARLSYAVLRGLTGRSGGMVAAATTSLPEEAEADRNYDYRYVWLRDQCYAGLAVSAVRPGDPLLQRAVEFVTARLLDEGPQLRPAYTTNGQPLPRSTRLGFAGYPGGTDICGNDASNQFQLDSFGEILQLLAAAHELLDDDGWRALNFAVDIIGKRWTEPDSGIWELGPAWWTQSRLSCVAGLRKAAAIAPRPAEIDLLADRILAETQTRCLHPAGYWQRSADDRSLDAALLMPAVRGARIDEAITRATLAQTRARLADDYYLYRFRSDGTSLGSAEGAFLLCGFVMSLAEAQQGNYVEAFRWYERNRAACGPSGLFAEEFDVEQRQLRGNLPQAFVHAMMLEAAARLPEGDSAG